MKRYGLATTLAMGTVLLACESTSSDQNDSLLDASSIRVTDASADAAPTYDPSTTELNGTLGTTGAIRPIVSSLVISNSGETLIYMTTAALTCDQLMVSRWLGAFEKDAQVIEIVVSGPAKLGAGKQTEVNWATGGRSSAYEQNAKTANVVFTRAEAMGVVEGTVTATYDNPAGKLTGHFHATFCPNGQDY
ncbi:MAG TPA: hypothetical protein VI299_05675 [Polyangiales bacterium]